MMPSLRTCLAGLQAALLLLILPVSVSAAHCTKPSIRKEWRTLSTSERADWISAINCLATLPHSDAFKPSINPQLPPVNTSSSFYDDLVYMHTDMGTLIRHNGYTFPWHRWILHSVENTLKTKCGFQGTTPYWDWRKDTSDIFGSSIFDPDPESGLGGSGDPNNDFQVQDGGFSVHSSFRLTYPYPHPLRRNLTIQPFLNVAPSLAQFYPNPAIYANSTLTYSAIDSMVNGFVGDYLGFQTAVEAFEGPLYSGHAMIGGDFGNHQCSPINAPPSCVNSAGPVPNDPLFWLHHGMIDKIWAEWQSKHPQNANAFYGGSVEALENVTYFNQWPTGAPPLLHVNDTMPNEGLFPANTIADMLSTTGDVLCYLYE